MTHSLNPFGSAQGAGQAHTELKQTFGPTTISDGARAFVGNVDKVQTMFEASKTMNNVITFTVPMVSGYCIEQHNPSVTLMNWGRYVMPNDTRWIQVRKETHYPSYICSDFLKSPYP